MVGKIQILVPSNWNNTERGNYFEDIVGKLFQQMQYKVVKRIRTTGMEIDILAEHLHTKEKAYVECKFLSEPFDATVVSKLLGNALDEDDISKAYLVATSEPGKEASGKIIKIQNKGNSIRAGVLRFAYVGPAGLVDLYLAVNQYPALAERLAIVDSQFKETISAATLVITPDEACWVLEQQRGGLPVSAFALPADPKLKAIRDYESFKRLVEENKGWPGLHIHNGVFNQSFSPSSSTESRREVITHIPVADRFDDYGPARPEDFVGRTDLQVNVFSFLEKVRHAKTNRRVIALSGPSGFGKSSVVLKLAHKAKNKHNRKKFYIYHIDSRSATSPLFVVDGIRAAFQKAVDDNFIGISGATILVDSVEDPFSSESIKACLSALQSQKRVLVIFFDQFEELLTKEPLFSTFEVFKKVAFLAESLEQNLVLGFAWRTGITFPEHHPAYHMWHSLQDKRSEFKIGLFSNSEAAEMITILERNLNEKIENMLRRHLLGQAQNYPWFLKKLCVHVFRQLSSRTNQRSLLERQLDATLLFQEDTRDLPTNHLACLKYIARNSPIDLANVQELFAPDVLDYLYRSRLIIKSGYKYSVYWDIFREYMVTGDVPSIPMTYIPQAQLSTVLSVLRYIIRQHVVSLEDIQSNFKYTIKTVWNITSDLLSFFLVKRGSDDKFVAAEEISGTDELENAVADYVAEQLKSHIVVKTFYAFVSPGEGMSQAELEELVTDVYPASSPTSLHTYINRILSWLRFTGLIDLEPPDVMVRPSGKGKDKGNVVIRHTQLIDGKALFFATSSPSRVVDLAKELCQKRSLSRKDIFEKANRNAAQDLTSLGLSQWYSKALHPSMELVKLNKLTPRELEIECRDIIKRYALDSRFLASLARQISISPGRTSEEIVDAIEQEFGRDWHPSSGKRYLGGGLRWLDFFGELGKLHGQMALFNHKE